MESRQRKRKVDTHLADKISGTLQRQSLLPLLLMVSLQHPLINFLFYNCPSLYSAQTFHHHDYSLEKQVSFYTPHYQEAKVK